jgi:hypothetical protein
MYQPATKPKPKSKKQPKTQARNLEQKTSKAYSNQAKELKLSSLNQMIIFSCSHSHEGYQWLLLRKKYRYS